MLIKVNFYLHFKKKIVIYYYEQKGETLNPVLHYFLTNGSLMFSGGIKKETLRRNRLTLKCLLVTQGHTFSYI